MVAMSPRQRLFHVLNGEPTDRPPVWLLFPYHPTGYYVDVRAHPAYRRVFDASLEHGVIMLNRRNLRASFHGPDVLTTEEETLSDGVPVRRWQLSCRGQRVFSETPLQAGARGKKLLASEEDLAVFCDLPVETREEVIVDSLRGPLDTYLRERSEFDPELGSMMLNLDSPVSRLYHSSVLEEFSIWSLTHDDIIVAWLDRVMKHLEVVYRFCLERDLADVYFLVGSELAAPPLVGLDTFRRWVLPYERRLIELIHGYGKKVIQHFHGQIHELLPAFAEMKPDGLHTIEAPPVGNCTLSQAFAATGESITLIGNIQYDEFRSATPEHMKRRVHEVLEEAGQRPFILSPTAGPFDPHPPARLIENYLAFIEAAENS